MHVTLIRPSNPSGSAYLTKWGFLPVPLGLLELAGSLLSLEDVKVKIIDMEADRQTTVDEVVDETVNQGADIVGLTIHATAAHPTSVEIARRIKELRPDTLLLAGGHHATFVPYDLLRGGFDFVILGEGDETITDIVNTYRHGGRFEDIPGVVFNAGGRDSPIMIQTKPRALIEDLDTLPLPAYHLVDKDAYTFNVFGEEKVAAVETSRGCPYACDFCSVTPTWGNKWRNKSNKRIMQELDQVRKVGYKWLFFTDDIFVVIPNVSHRRALFNSMIEHGYNDMKWIVQMRADVTARNPELIKLGAQAGMSIAFLGVESGSEEVLRKLHKGIFTSQSMSAVRVLDQNGIIVLLGMMLGAPYETFKDLTTTLRFSKRLAEAGADAVQFTLYTPLPGTRIFEDSLRKRKLFTLDWGRYDILTPVMKTKVHPVLVQILQYYGSYSFFLTKWLKGKLRRGSEQMMMKKKELTGVAEKYIYGMLPNYAKDFLLVPALLLKTLRSYSTGKRNGIVGEREAEELLESSSRVIYQQTEGKNPYFMIKESDL